MDPRAFLTVTGNLHASGEEANRRTAVSRAYYALYLTAHQLLKAETLPLHDGPADHRRVPEYLMASGNQEIENVGKVLQDLRHERVLADYRMNESKFNQNLCALIFAKARQSLNVLDSLDRGAKRVIVANIKAQHNFP